MKNYPESYIIGRYSIIDMEMEDDEEGENEEAGNKILYLTDLPEEITKSEEIITKLFDQYPGFKETRLIPSKKDIAFVEYHNVQQAVEAKRRLDGFELKKGVKLRIHFAKM
jgi:U2 small nuclear ribonucleoprotein B''